MERNLHLKRSDFITIIDINLEYLRKLDYNLIIEEEANSLERLLYILICDDKEKRKKLYREDTLMDKVNEKIEELTKDFGSLYYDKEEYRKEVMKEVIETEYIEKGAKNKAIEIAKNLLELNINIKNIEKATGLSKEEIENL